LKRIVYTVICACNNGDEKYHIDSTWTSLRKAEKRKNKLNSLGFKYLQEEYGYGFFEVEYLLLSK
jgi:hypothetical protein